MPESKKAKQAAPGKRASKNESALKDAIDDGLYERHARELETNEAEDLLIAACDPWRYELDFGVTGHRSCSDNFLEVLAPWQRARHQIPQPVNFFQNMSYPDGRVEFGESLAKAGDVLEMQALMDLVAAVSACPMDLNPISGYRVTDIALEIV